MPTGLEVENHWCVGHLRTAHSKRFGLIADRLARCLVLNLEVKLGAEQNDNDRDPNPGHEPDDRARANHRSC